MKMTWNEVSEMQWMTGMNGMNERMEGTNECMHAWMNEWMNEWLNGWMNEWVNERNETRRNAMKWHE